ncbi:hypothetical protein L2E82_15625 [Cichorium intybus]|uniref:Uncharacterized protein n=1 Tax=Cichorium intybus TaxID=13427 RepID=A0ACB9F3A3_CICIN|nr:hypothetical protein L2E82_15625 [Cichorium intybus]
MPLASKLTLSTNREHAPGGFRISIVMVTGSPGLYTFLSASNFNEGCTCKGTGASSFVDSLLLLDKVAQFIQMLVLQILPTDYLFVGTRMLHQFSSLQPLPWLPHKRRRHESET